MKPMLRFVRWRLHALLCVLLFGIHLQAQMAADHSEKASNLRQGEDKSFIGMQYEPWFFSQKSWATAEAIPLLGRYNTDESTVAKHFREFKDLGIDWILIDWSNMLWSTPEWEKHTGETKQLEEKTDILFKTALDLRRKGEYAPKFVFLLGRQNGPPVSNGSVRLNQVLAWLEQHYLDRPEYSDSWLYYQGKPLITILYWPPNPCQSLPKEETSVSSDKRWTVRWMASQLQDNHAENCGMWSWMDGTIPQVVTRRDGRPEDVVVTPASFYLPGTGTGWIAPSASPRDHGVTYLRSWRAAFNSRPAFIQIHQWNEFAGQKDNNGLQPGYWSAPSVNPKATSTVYADEYDLERSDDIEPTDLRACTMRGCGGWGWYYYNLTKALIALYRGEAPDITVLALSSSSTNGIVRGRSLTLHWDYVGKDPSGFKLLLDGKRIATVERTKEYQLDLSGVSPGEHRIKLIAVSAHTYFDLDPRYKTRAVKQPLPVVSEITFSLRN